MCDYNELHTTLDAPLLENMVARNKIHSIDERSSMLVYGEVDHDADMSFREELRGMIHNLVTINGDSLELVPFLEQKMWIGDELKYQDNVELHMMNYLS